jgi:hypothetical protein
VRESVRQPVRYFSRPSGKEVDVENGGEAGGRADRQVSGGAWSVERGAWHVSGCQGDGLSGLETNLLNSVGTVISLRMGAH